MKNFKTLFFGGLLLLLMAIPVILSAQSTGVICAVCNKKAYPQEIVDLDGKHYHKACFRCSVCKSVMNASTVRKHQGALYCKIHYDQKIKGTSGTLESKTPTQGPTQPTE